MDKCTCKHVSRHEVGGGEFGGIDRSGCLVHAPPSLRAPKVTDDRFEKALATILHGNRDEAAEGCRLARALYAAALQQRDERPTWDEVREMLIEAYLLGDGAMSDPELAAPETADAIIREARPDQSKKVQDRPTWGEVRKIAAEVAHKAQALEWEFDLSVIDAIIREAREAKA